MIQTSKRAASIDSSGIRKVFDLAAKLKDPINLSIGQADFDVFDEVKAAAKGAIDSGKNGYTVTQGLPELRSAIANQYGYEAGGAVSEFITSGVSGGLLLAYMAMLDPGDEVLIPDPFFCIHRDAALLVNAKVNYYNTYPDFRLRPDVIERAITPKTRAIVVCSPSNPTGYALAQEELDSVIEVARKHNIWCIYDEIYSSFCFDHPHAKAQGRYEQTLILNGFSKSMGAAGWRIAYAIGPKALIQEMLKIQQYTFVCAPSPAQWGMLAGMNRDMSPQVETYRVKRDFICEALKNDFNFVRPSGAFYIFPEAPGGNGTKFVERCIENSLLVVPGNVFSTRDTHFRISFSAPMQQLERGVEVLLKLVR